MENNDDIQEPQVMQPAEDPIKELLQKQEEKIDHLEKTISDNKRVLIDLSKKLDQYYKILFYQPIVAAHHQKVFAGCRGIHKNQEVVLLASGPTLNHFSPDMIPNAVFAGVNKVIMSEQFGDVLNYWFTMDYGSGIGQEANELAKVHAPRCKKYFGIMKPGHISEERQHFWQFPISYIEENNGQYFYITDSALFPYDITLFPFTSGGSVIFPLIQFVMYTHPKRIYLVGCDCKGVHYNDTALIPDSACKMLLQWWNWSRDYFGTYYPDIEVISINPVGLKGIFHDVYTKSYLAEHPEIDSKTVEIIDR